MKKVILTAAFVLIYIHLSAQPPMSGGGRGGRPPGDTKGERPLMQNGNVKQENFMILAIPDIPDLSLKQRGKLSKEITNERKDISKLMTQKQALMMDAQNPGMAEKERQKLFDKMAKIDDKIIKKEEKYDKKYRSILSDAQYTIFIVSKQDIQFRGQGRKGERPAFKQPDGYNNQRDTSSDGMF